MKIGITLCLLTFSLTLFAEEPFEKRTNGYVFGGIGGTSGDSFVTWNSGVGFESVFYKGLGITGEVSYLSPVQAPLWGIGVFSLNGTYYFRRGEISPFVTGGYSLFFREGAANLLNVGAGVQIPSKSGHRLRLEFRNHFLSEFSETFHLFGVRIGWTF